MRSNVEKFTDVPNVHLPLSSFVKERDHIATFRRIAKIMGPQSASAQAISEYDRKVAAGEDADIVRYGSSLIVIGGAKV